MRHLFKITFDNAIILGIKDNKLNLPEKLVELLPNKEEILLTISIPDNSSNIYSLIIEKTLLLNKDSKHYFESLSSCDILFCSLQIREEYMTTHCEINFSSFKDFSDISITERPLISQDLITNLKKVLI